MTGYISIQRKLREHWLYKEDRVFSKFEAWIDILYEVNHTDNKFLFDGSLVEVKRGSTITSLRKMSEKWKWSITKVNAFLKMLEEDEMLVVKKDTKKTLLTVVNYDFYQSEKCKKEQQSNTEVTQKRQQSNTEVTQKRQQSNTEVTQKETNNNELIITNNELIIINNEKEEKEEEKERKENKKNKIKEEDIYIQHFHLILTKAEYDDLLTVYKKRYVDDLIETIKAYSKDYLEKYSNFKAVIHNWIKKVPDAKLPTEKEIFRKYGGDV